MWFKISRIKAKMSKSSYLNSSLKIARFEGRFKKPLKVRNVLEKNGISKVSEYYSFIMDDAESNNEVINSKNISLLFKL